MKKLLAVISLAFVVGVGVHAQQSKTQTVIESLKQSKPKAAQTEQANSTEPLLAFRIYEKGIIFSAQGQPDQACAWDGRSNSIEFKELLKIEMQTEREVTWTGQRGWSYQGTLHCSFKSTPKSTLDCPSRYASARPYLRPRPPTLCALTGYSGWASTTMTTVLTSDGSCSPGRR